MKTVWIVGASQGIGYELCGLLLEADYRVVASSRNAEQSEKLLVLRKKHPQTLSLLNLDVTDKVSIDAKTESAWQTFNGIDLWFYNAGAYEPVTIDQATDELFEQLNQVNYLGAAFLATRLNKHFQTSDQTAMKWLWNISLASQFGLPYGGAYSAPKAALLNLAEALKPELTARGIELQIINHGFVKTRLTAKNDFDMPGLMEPSEAAVQIAKWIQSNRNGFELNFPWGLTVFLKLLRYLPYRLSFALTRRLLKNGQ